MPAALNLPPRDCDICRTTFQPVHKRGRYCSKPCFWKSKNQRVTPEAKARYAETRRRVWADNRETYNERAKRYRLGKEGIYRQRALESYHVAREITPWKPLLSNVQERAKKKGIVFSLTSEWAEARWTGRCEVTDIPFWIGRRGNGPSRLGPSVDRIDPRVGYIPDNCRFILMAVNAMKQNGSDEEMLEIAKAIVLRMSMRD